MATKAVNKDRVRMNMTCLLGQEDATGQLSLTSPQTGFPWSFIPGAIGHAFLAEGHVPCGMAPVRRRILRPRETQPGGGGHAADHRRHADTNTHLCCH